MNTVFYCIVGKVVSETACKSLTGVEERFQGLNRSISEEQKFQISQFALPCLLLKSSQNEGSGA